MENDFTYSLRLNKPNSDGYYQKIAALADRWLSEARFIVGDIIDQYTEYRRSVGLSERSLEELVFELLALGVELYENGAQAAGYPFWAARLLEELVEKQIGMPQLEKSIKTLRGLVSGLGSSFSGNIKPGELETIALTRGTGRPLPVQGDPDVGCTLYVQRLIQWLHSQGRTSDAKRFAEWDAFIESFEPVQSQEIILRTLTFAHEFDNESAPILDGYTEGIGESMPDIGPKTIWRYDPEVATYSRLDYHLRMFGIELLNRAFRKPFLAAKRKVVILPACMRARLLAYETDEKCQAVETPLGSLCQECTPACRINQITQIGKKTGFETIILQDRLHSASLKAFCQGENVGLVNIACPLTAWDVNWDIEDAGVPVQGMLLDFANCRDHCNPARPTQSEIITDINIKKLMELLALS